MMEKLGIRGVADLVRMAEKARISKNSDPGSIGPTVNSTGNQT
jgi:hypothetical protein